MTNAIQIAGCQSAWSELAVLDPTSDRSGGQESLNVVPRLFPATQLLLSYELQRAHERLSTIPGNTEGRSILEDALCPVAEGLNALPSYLLMKGTLGALVVCDEVVPGTGIQQVELALIDSVSPRPGWTAPFLLRSDERSEVVVRLLDVEERSCRCRCRHGRSPMTLSPANFICQVFLEHEGGTMRIDSEGFARFHAMRQIIVGIFERRQRVYQQRRQDEDLSNETEKDLQPKLALSNVTNLLSPDRSSSNKDIKEINKERSIRHQRDQRHQRQQGQCRGGEEGEQSDQSDLTSFKVLWGASIRIASMSRMQMNYSAACFQPLWRLRRCSV
eukprot:s2436_g3.t1